jgi:hypothetical protein
VRQRQLSSRQRFGYCEGKLTETDNSLATAANGLRLGMVYTKLADLHPRDDRGGLSRVHHSLPHFLMYALWFPFLGASAVADIMCCARCTEVLFESEKQELLKRRPSTTGQLAEPARWRDHGASRAERPSVVHVWSKVCLLIEYVFVESGILIYNLIFSVPAHGRMRSDGSWNGQNPSAANHRPTRSTGSSSQVRPGAY